MQMLYKRKDAKESNFKGSYNKINFTAVIRAHWPLWAHAERNAK